MRYAIRILLWVAGVATATLYMTWQFWGRAPTELGFNLVLLGLLSACGSLAMWWLTGWVTAEHHESAPHHRSRL